MLAVLYKTPFLMIIRMILLISLGCLSGVQAQVKTLQDETGRISGFGGPYFGVTQLLDEVGLHRGAGGGVLVGGFFLGGFLESSFSSSSAHFGDYTIGILNGGIWTGYSILNRERIHPYVSLKAGWGGLTLQDRDNFEASYTDSVLSLQPEVGVELNLTRLVRLVVTGGYRQVLQVDGFPFGLESEDFSGLSGQITLRLGGFAPRPSE